MVVSCVVVCQCFLKLTMTDLRFDLFHLAKPMEVTFSSFRLELKDCRKKGSGRVISTEKGAEVEEVSNPHCQIWRVFTLIIIHKPALTFGSGFHN